MGSAFIQVKQFPILSLFVESEKKCASLQSNSKSFTFCSFNFNFALLNAESDSAAVKTISAWLIIVFFVAIDESDHFNSPHSVFPTAIKYLSLKQSFFKDSKIWSSFTFRLLNPSDKFELYLDSSALGILFFIWQPNSATLSLVIALVHFPPFSKE